MWLYGIISVQKVPCPVWSNNGMIGLMSTILWRYMYTLILYIHVDDELTKFSTSDFLCYNKPFLSIQLSFGLIILKCSIHSWCPCYWNKFHFLYFWSYFNTQSKYDKKSWFKTEVSLSGRVLSSFQSLSHFTIAPYSQVLL